MIFTQNNLVTSSSPYLQQHKDNPIWWQEWSPESLSFAQKAKKILFVSVGYATCHWCHVMAREAFQDQKIADFLNQHFVSIKVDREQRPDIDAYMLAYINSMGAQGGWPLNCFLSPDLRPIFALTYAPEETRQGMPGFDEILRQVKTYYEQNVTRLTPFSLKPPQAQEQTEEEFVAALWKIFDTYYGGFGRSMKFPMPSTLLFALYYLDAVADEKLRIMIEKTLDAILWRGLHDHLQGGFFRYCVDREWTIPHFEKMLYDQAMLLWVYSLAYKMFQKEAYGVAVRKIISCLEETFAVDHLYCSGHDADTDHEEGATYLWTDEELRRILTLGEFQRFSDVYAISPQGNFEGKNHLLKRQPVFLDDIEAKLLSHRKKRAQPFTDKKFITSWNCLVAIGLIHAHRYAPQGLLLDKARLLFKTLWREHYRAGRLAHSSLNGEVQKGDFLTDYGSMLLLLTYLYEETGYFKEEIQEFCGKVKSFKQGDAWIESSNEDFIMVPADSLDHPTPSSIALAELGLLRADILLGRDYSSLKYREVLNNDFYNIAAQMSHGLFHIIKSPQRVEWNTLAVNCIQIKSHTYMECYQGRCQEETSSPLGLA